MGKSLAELGLKPEQLPTAGESMVDAPMFGGGTPPPPQPGPYRFKLPPAGQLVRGWDAFDAGRDKGMRVSLVLDEETPLTIVRGPMGKHVGETFRTKINNNERKRGKDGKLMSDLDYVIRAYEGPEATKPPTNPAYIEKINTFAGREFDADIAWSWHCQGTRNIRVRDAQGAIQEVPNKPGCGARYYDRDVPKGADGATPLEIKCECGAIVRAFGNLDNIRA